MDTEAAPAPRWSTRIVDAARFGAATERALAHAEDRAAMLIQLEDARTR